MKIVKGMAFVALTASLLACMGGDGSFHVVQFSSSPDSIYEGDATTLNWNSPAGSRVISSNFNAQTATGSMTIYPSSTTTYEIKVRLASNDVVTEKTTVYVNSLPDDGGDGGGGEEESLTSKRAINVSRPQ